MKIVITGFVVDEANEKEINDITLHRPYEIVEDGDDEPYFIDDSGEKNYGCAVGDSVYDFNLIE